MSLSSKNYTNVIKKLKKLNLFLTETFLQSLQSLKEIEIEIEILFLRP